MDANTAALRNYQAAQDRAESRTPYLAEALETVVEALVTSGAYPESGPAKLLLRDVLDDDGDWFEEMLTARDPVSAQQRVRNELSARLRNKIADHYVVNFLAQDYIEAAKECAREE